MHILYTHLFYVLNAYIYIYSLYSCICTSKQYICSCVLALDIFTVLVDPAAAAVGFLRRPSPSGNAPPTTEGEREKGQNYDRW